MSEYFIYYTSINIVGAVIFGIMLWHDRMRVDKQEKQLRYDQALIAFMLYYVSDAIWVGVDSGVFPANSFTILATDFSNFVIMTAITYTWLRYVMAVEQIPRRNSGVVRFTLLFPFAISVMVLIVTYLVAPGLLIDENFKTTGMFDAFMVTVPYIYLIAVIVYTVRAAIREENPIEKRKHLYIGFLPIMVVVGGLIQMVLIPFLPMFCFAGIIFMLMFYIQSIESQISTDPLTKLNNRGQLVRYVSQESNLWIEGRSTYVLMMDINDFKKINDTFGHAEGDVALVMLSATLVNVVKRSNIPIFLGRYGGDEFVLIAHPTTEKELNELVREIREEIRKKCEKEKKPYYLSVGIGLDELIKEQDAFAKCIKRADDKMYQNKKEMKKLRESTAGSDEK